MRNRDNQLSEKWTNKNTNGFYICKKKKSEDKHAKDKTYRINRDHCYYRGKYRDSVQSISNLIYSGPKQIPAVASNGSNYHYHFIINDLVEKFEGLFRKKILKNICLEKKYWKIHNILSSNGNKKLKQLIKKENESQYSKAFIKSC